MLRNVVITERELELIYAVIGDWKYLHQVCPNYNNRMIDFHMVLGLQASLPAMDNE